MELERSFGLLCQLYSLAEASQLPPLPIWAHIQGHHLSAKIDDTSLKLPVHKAREGPRFSRQPESRTS
jgi:hypothetical protein